MSGNNVLSLLGLALRGGRLAVGEEPAALAAKAGQARLLLVASDAAGNTRRRAEHLAEEGHCLWLALPFAKAELGGALGRGSAAIAALTDLGLAAAVAERLAQLDPEHYGEAAARMDLKRRRATERKAAPRRDPPKKAPPPDGRDRRPPKPRREGDRPRKAGAGDRRPPGTAPGRGNAPERDALTAASRERAAPGTGSPDGPEDRGPAAPRAEGRGVRPSGEEESLPLAGTRAGGTEVPPRTTGPGGPPIFIKFLRSQVRLKAGGGSAGFQTGFWRGAERGVLFGY